MRGVGADVLEREIDWRDCLGNDWIIILAECGGSASRFLEGNRNLCV